MLWRGNDGGSRTPKQPLCIPRALWKHPFLLQKVPHFTGLHFLHCALANSRLNSVCALKLVSWSDSFGLFNHLGNFQDSPLHRPSTAWPRTVKVKISAVRTKAPYIDPARTVSIGIGAPYLGHWLHHMEFGDPHTLSLAMSPSEKQELLQGQH